jgi:metal-responsive CopG/Arc/MetJ family transcriptional regulator
VKTAISVQDDLLREADKAARQLGLSRSALISLAVRRYLLQRRREQMVEDLNRVYADHPDPTEKKLVKLMKAKTARAVKDKW